MTRPASRRGAVEILPAAAVLVLIGAQPHTDWLQDVVARDGWAYVATAADLFSMGRGLA